MLDAAKEGRCIKAYSSIGRLSRGHWKHFVADIKKEKFKTSPVIMYDRLCKDCFSPIYRGSNHTEIRCKSKRQSLENISDAVTNSHSSMDVIASQYLRTRVNESGGSASIQVRSDTGGHPLNVSVGKSDMAPPPSISHEQAKIIQVEANQQQLWWYWQHFI